MRAISSYTEAELLQEIAHCVSLEGEAKAQAKPLRDELRKRQVESGEIAFEHDGWVSRLKREAFSLAWFKRQTGYTEADIPPECFKEKFSMEVDWEKVNDWHQEQHGSPLETTYSLTVERMKAK